MNQDTEQNGLNAVIAHEKKSGREAKRVHKCGYDLLSIGEGQERHIEVKSTSKSHFTSRWLEELEWNHAQNDPHFFLYLVTEAETAKPRVFEYDREKLQKRFSGLEHHYVYRFKKSDFK